MSHMLFSLLPSPRRQIACVLPDTTIEECINLLVAKDIGAVVVMDEDNLYGILSERDIIRECIFSGINLKQVRAQDVACKNVTTLDEHDTVEKAMQVITFTKRRHILFSEDGKITAVISIGDLMKSLLDDNNRVIEHLEKYITGEQKI